MDYGIILDGMNYSYSSVNTFDTCNLSFKMTYIDIEEKMGNAFGEYGSYMHSILEKFFRDKVDIWDLSKYYKKNYKRSIKCSFPSFPNGMSEKYFQQGIDFFNSFDFDKEKYEVVHIEEKISTQWKDFKFVFIADLVLKDKETGEYILYDYKTANLFTKDRVDKKKLASIKKQVHLYAYFLWYTKQIEISKIRIWAIRNNKVIDMDYDNFYGLEALEWLETTVKKIKEEKDWEYDNSSPYFCQNLCSVRISCPFMSNSF